MSPRSTPAPDLIARLRAGSPDAAFVCLHGRDGEDGTVQELLEILGIPYTGSGVLACVRTTDKVLTKHMLVEASIPTPSFFSFTETAFKQLGAADTLPAIEAGLGYPDRRQAGPGRLGARRQAGALRPRAAGRARLGLLIRPAGPARAARGRS